jgi:hypothetical protein
MRNSIAICSFVSMANAGSVSQGHKAGQASKQGERDRAFHGAFSRVKESGIEAPIFVELTEPNGKDCFGVTVPKSLAG